MRRAKWEGWDYRGGNIDSNHLNVFSERFSRRRDRKTFNRTVFLFNVFYCKFLESSLDAEKVL